MHAAKTLRFYELCKPWQYKYGRVEILKCRKETRQTKSLTS